jgi:hypothetical protein
VSFVGDITDLIPDKKSVRDGVDGLTLRVLAGLVQAECDDRTIAITEPVYSFPAPPGGVGKNVCPTCTIKIGKDVFVFNASCTFNYGSHDSNFSAGIKCGSVQAYISKTDDVRTFFADFFRGKDAAEKVRLQGMKQGVIDTAIKAALVDKVLEHAIDAFLVGLNRVILADKSHPLDADNFAHTSRTLQSSIGSIISAHISALRASGY